MAAPADPEAQHPATERSSLSRRKFLQGAGGVAAGSVLTQGLLSAAHPATAATAATGKQPGDDVEKLSGEIEVELTINGARQKVKVEPRTSLLNALRNHCQPPLTGTKLVCDRGQCGACTVMIDDKPAYACLLLAADVRGKKIRTIEGLGSPENLSPLQSAFWKHDASMCGFCTSGFVMSITACLERNPAADLDAIKGSCAGNVCRCGTYPHIFAAALEAAQAMSKGGKR